MSDFKTKDEFIISSREYLEKLKEASNFDEMLRLWRATSIPYKMDSCDPYSPQYRDEVKEIYKQLTHSDYAAKNEWTSDKQSEQEFDVGYPWVSNNLRVVAEELAKPVQIFQALHLSGKSGSRIIEFGAGWGNLALPLARARLNVTVVDIDEGFIGRLHRKAEREGLSISSYCGDFLEAAQSLENKFDVVIFQSSFHHCLDFKEILETINSRLLEPEGVIIFSSEPISNEINFPWGLRYDGESLWAIMCNKWLELGFNFNFFVEMLLNCGFFIQGLPGIAGYIGEAWQATRAEFALDFDKVILPSACDQTFHPADAGFAGRFCTNNSKLPGLNDQCGKLYELVFTNYGTRALDISVEGVDTKQIVIDPGATETARVKVGNAPIFIHSETFVPDEQSGNGDVRVLGASLQRIRLSESD
jgi:2-polyprenyl-3-methyl-5-hydroxy-6-metoxy-1,4-benzoquinol methylase